MLNVVYNQINNSFTTLSMWKIYVGGDEGN